MLTWDRGVAVVNPRYTKESLMITEFKSAHYEGSENKSFRVVNLNSNQCIT